MILFLIAWTLRDGSKHLATIKAENPEHARLLTHAALVGGPDNYRTFLKANCDDMMEFNIHRVTWPSLMLFPIR